MVDNKLLAVAGLLLLFPIADVKPGSGIVTIDGFATGAPGPTPLIAVCHLILALAEAGKLPR